MKTLKMECISQRRLKINRLEEKIKTLESHVQELETKLSKDKIYTSNLIKTPLSAEVVRIKEICTKILKTVEQEFYALNGFTLGIKSKFRSNKNNIQLDDSQGHIEKFFGKMVLENNSLLTQIKNIKNRINTALGEGKISLH